MATFKVTIEVRENDGDFMHSHSFLGSSLALELAFALKASGCATRPQFIAELVLEFDENEQVDAEDRSEAYEQLVAAAQRIREESERPADAS